VSRLARIRTQVEAGEVLSEEDHRELARAAAESDGPTLRLALGHALINAGAEREALGLLESLARTFAGDLQVHLGLARALLGLERFVEAEAALHRALALSPEDPEALKVLAVLAMRRGEHARATDLIQRAVERDPLDGEALLVEAELAAVEPSPVARVLPVLRGGDFEPPGALWTPGPAGLRLYYVLEHPELLRYLPAADLVPATVAAAARVNLAQLPAELRLIETEGDRLFLAAAPTGLWALATGDGHDAARLACLNERQWEAIRAVTASEGPFGVSLARRELVLLCDESDPEAVKRLEASGGAPDGIEGRFRLTPAGLE